MFPYMLHPVIPARRALENLPAGSNRTFGLRWWCSPDFQTVDLQLLNAIFPFGSFLLLSLDWERSMHTAKMLGKEILTIELVAAIFRSTIGVGRGIPRRASFGM